MIYKTYETKSSFYVKENTSGKVFLLFLKSFFASIKKGSILAEKLGTRLSFYESLDTFSIYPHFLRF